MARRLDNGNYLCSACNEEKAVTAFGRRKSGEIAGYCKSCRNSKARSDRAANPEHFDQIVKKSRKKRQEETGMSLYERETMKRRKYARLYMREYARRHPQTRPSQTSFVNRVKPWRDPLGVIQLDWVERLVEKQRELAE